ncbi:hypothetical protein PHK61_26265 [Actinomycetospora lutea]|uniref:hypothetical protein n=1 Tax=Actinomycetospora lutea TaxID=663604 RepID=UPI00236738CE|nr:hypothetical protein [Actinomycetospora lutea]MDD7941924.1 hypothetical protein [Actinomycetospora lutea]
MAVMRAGDRWAAAVDTAVGTWLRAQDAHFGASRVDADGTHTVSWYFAPTSAHAGRRRRERVLVFRTRDEDDWEVELAERAAAEPGRVRETAANAARTDRAGLPATVQRLLAGGLARHRRRPARVPRAPADLGSPVLGLVLGVAMLLGARLDIDLAPGIVALALPLLGVNACRLVARLVRG